MNEEQLRQKWQDLLRKKKYPGLILRRGCYPPGEEETEPVFDVFMIPDESSVDFFYFYIDSK